MKLFELEPEVAGGFGKNTIITNIEKVRQKIEKPIINHLHYEFYGWLGDDLLETTPCFIVTTSLLESIRNSDLDGYKFEDIEISKSDEFNQLYPKRILPKFKRILPQGTVVVSENKIEQWSGDDFCLSQHSTLVVSERALNILRSKNIDHCDIRELK
jgi:hypothetical protein